MPQLDAVRRRHGGRQRAAVRRHVVEVSDWPGHGSGAALHSVSCPSSSFCAAVGYSSGITVEAVAYVGGGGGFNFNNTFYSSHVELNSVSCASSTFCAAIARGSAFAAMWGQTSSWSGYGVLDPTFVDPFHILGPTVSCPSPSFCMMVDVPGNAATYNGTSWSAATRIDNGTWLTSVSCPTSSFCAAVDSNGNALTYNGTSWSAPVKIDGSNRLTGVSCPTSTFCVAVDGGAGRSPTGLRAYPRTSHDRRSRARPSSVRR